MQLGFRHTPEAEALDRKDEGLVQRRLRGRALSVKRSSSGEGEDRGGEEMEVTRKSDGNGRGVAVLQ